MKARGFSLLSTLVSFTIFTLLTLALFRLFAAQHRRATGIAMHGSLEDVRQLIRQGLSCQKTRDPANNPHYLPGPPVQCKGPITLFNKAGLPMTDPSGWMGGWHLTTTCDAQGNLFITATAPLSGGKFRADPLLNLPLDAAHPKALLFGRIPAPCADRGPALGANGAYDAYPEGIPFSLRASDLAPVSPVIPAGKTLVLNAMQCFPGYNSVCYCKINGVPSAGVWIDQTGAGGVWAQHKPPLHLYSGQALSFGGSVQCDFTGVLVDKEERSGEMFFGIKGGAAIQSFQVPLGKKMVISNIVGSALACKLNGGLAIGSSMTGPYVFGPGTSVTFQGVGCGFSGVLANSERK